MSLWPNFIALDSTQSCTQIYIYKCCSNVKLMSSCSLFCAARAWIFYLRIREKLLCFIHFRIKPVVKMCAQKKFTLKHLPMYM
jgi:hypothetical protein